MIAKNRILVLMLAIAMAVGTLFLVSSCGEEPAGCQHKDADRDYLCDECGIEFLDECLEHTDLNKDGFCDYCETEVELICEHVDANSDEKCDICAEAFVCEHVDANADNKCDKCTAFVPCAEHTDANDDGKCDKCAEVLEARVDGIQATLDAYADSVPTKVITNTDIEFYDAYETLVYTLVANSELITGSKDGKLTTTRVTSIDRILDIAAGAGEIILEPFSPVKTTEEYQQGLGRRTNGGNWRSDGLNFAPTSRMITLAITADNVTNVKYTEELYNNTLTFTVPVANIDAVFGVDANGDSKIVSDTAIKVTVVNNGAVVTSVEIEYERYGDDDTYPTQVVIMKTEYSYDIQDVKLLY